MWNCASWNAQVNSNSMALFVFDFVDRPLSLTFLFVIAYSWRSSFAIDCSYTSNYFQVRNRKHLNILFLEDFLVHLMVQSELKLYFIVFKFLEENLSNFISLSLTMNVTATYFSWLNCCVCLIGRDLWKHWVGWW